MSLNQARMFVFLSATAVATNGKATTAAAWP